MMETMRALVKRGDGFEGTELENVPIPDVIGDRTVLRVLAAGICATAIHLADGKTLPRGPVVLGHEIVGEVASPGASAYSRGDRMVGYPLYYRCRRCPACKRGAWNLPGTSVSSACRRA